MSLRALAALAVLIGLVGCDTKKETLSSVQHRAGWQRQAGQSVQEAARLAKQAEKNTGDLKKAIQEGLAGKGGMKLMPLEHLLVSAAENALANINSRNP